MENELDFINDLNGLVALRDKFAGQAMSGLTDLAYPEVRAYQIADAMLKQRIAKQ